MPERTQNIRGFDVEEFDHFTSAVDREFDALVEQTAGRKLRLVTSLPQEDEYQDREEVLFVDDNDQLGGGRGALYRLVKYRGLWYKTAALTAAR